MDYKEKYEQALERAKIWQEHLYEVGDKDYADELNYIFPELKESEDEKIRKALIDFHQNSLTIKGINAKKIIAWLEKQGEQTINQPDFEIPFGAKDSELIEESYYIPKGYHAEISKDKVTIKNGEQKPVEWSEEDEYLLVETVKHLEELIEIDKAKHCGCDVQYYQRDIDWLKSLKQRIGG